MDICGRLTGTASMVLAALVALWSTQAQALFKVVNPDGTITYTDRPPQVVPNTRITNLARPGSPTLTEPDLRAMYAYLKAQPAVLNEVPANQGPM